MLAHGSPKSVYIGGGGELATARETLRWKTVEKVVMVDIDEIVVNVCKEQLPEWNDGCVEDPRLEVHYDDAKGFLERYEGKFDVIIMDIADPIEEFYDFAISKLNPGGVFVTQSGPGSFLVVDECGTVIHQTLKGAFQHVAHYAADVPSFGSNWGFNVAYNDDCAIAKSSSAAGRDPALYFLEAPLKEIDDALEQNLKG
ncbi:speE, partial [Symbiodinium sp. KB8]